MSSMWDVDDEPTQNLQTSVNTRLNKPVEKGYKSLGGVGIGRGRGFGNMTFLRQSLPSVGQETSGSDSSHTNGHSNNNWDDYETSSYGAKCNMQSDRNQSFKPKRGENSVSGGRISSRFSSTDGSDREIPRGGGTGDHSSRVCYKCNEEGHMSRNCPKSSGLRRNKGKGCFNCGEDGHMSRDCKNPDKRVGRDGKPREAPYIPPEPTENENELFDGVPQGINFARYEEIPVKLSGSNAPRPINNFEDIGFRETIMKNIRRCKYDKPTPVQKYAMPIVKANRDLMACAQTGSGKTAAFLLPMIQELIDSPDLSNPSFKTVQEPLAVVISPTRELAIQIFNEARKFSHNSIIKTELVYGGTSGGYQLQRLSKGCHILVATPGRLLDFVERGKVAFSQVRYLILDEADRMLDMGFMPAVKKMVSDPSMTVKSKRQTLMFSATFPEEIQRLAAEFLKPDYLFLAVGVVGSANMDVEQNFYQVQQYDKRQKLLEILNNSGTDRTLVFVGQKRTADFIALYMCQKGFPTTSIHGDRLQREREEALMDFRTGRMPVLVATAVAARGLDIKDVRHVINYDLPQEIDEYVHRIGRTGRVGNVGRATSFYDSSVDSGLARPLLKILAEANQEIPPWLEEAAKYATGTGVLSVGGARSCYGARDFRAKGASRRNDAWETKEDVTSTYGGPPSVHNSDNFSSPLVDDEDWG